MKQIVQYSVSECDPKATNSEHQTKQTSLEVLTVSDAVAADGRRSCEDGEFGRIGETAAESS